jgi:hypothetical protein
MERFRKGIASTFSWRRWGVVTPGAISHLPKETRKAIFWDQVRLDIRTWQTWVSGLVFGALDIGADVVAHRFYSVFAVTDQFSFFIVRIVGLMVALACSLVIVVPSSQRNRRRVWLSHRICPACGYDIRATPDRCPECGNIVAKII